MDILVITLIIVAIGLLIPSSFLLLEVIASWFPSRLKTFPDKGSRPNVTILIPAHNEAKNLFKMLKVLLSQVTPQDRIVVIADNCTDETANIARQLQVTVIERQNEHRRGKGYALDYGLQFLSANPPEVVVILDADCLMTPHTLDDIVGLAWDTQRPVQATYLMQPEANSTVRDKISAFAIVVKNLVRPLGLANLGVPCLLNGSGMAFPWSIIGQVSLANSHTVDDMQLSVDLAIAGYVPLYYSQGQVIGRLMQHQDAKSQRIRWEHGHLALLYTQVPRLLKAAWIEQRLDLLALALELSVPPLSFLIIFWFAATSLALLASFLNFSGLPLLLLAIEGILIATAVVGAWLKFARTMIPAVMLLTIPLYIVWKLPIYLMLLIRPQTNWNKTERDLLPPENVN